MSFDDFLTNIGIKPGMHIIMHVSFRKLRSAFPEITISTVIAAIQEILTPEGSLMMPAFSFCFKKTNGEHSVFCRKSSPSKVGAVSEVFRRSKGVVRTSSPTHSFTLWGKAASLINEKKSPTSPLGKESPLHWLEEIDNSHVLMFGVDFSALSFAHYIEVKAPVPWCHVSPLQHSGLEDIAVSQTDEQPLVEIPGCSKNFIHLEKYLLDRKFISPFKQIDFCSSFTPIQLLYREGLHYFQTYPEKLLCPLGECQACDNRWNFYLKNIKPF